MNAGRAITGLLLLVAAELLPMPRARASPERWTAVPGRSEVVVHVYKKGLFSGLAHDHHFGAGRFRATLELDEAGRAVGPFEVVVRADSLRDRQPDLSDEDRAKVDAQAAGEEVLDAARYPEIRFASEAPVEAGPALRAAGRFEGDLAGTLSLHGQRRPLVVAVQASREGGGWRARGSVRFRQSDFGIEPYSGFLGTVAVHDEIQVDFDLWLERAARPEGG